MKKRKVITSQPERYLPTETEGLNSIQIQTRIDEGLDNYVSTRNSKSYFKIVFDNVFTFFNLLCLLCFAALIIVKAGFADYAFIAIYASNISLGIFQEIRAKRTLEHMTILNSPTTKVIRNGEECVIPLKSIVLDDVLLLELGSQIPADCILMSGKVEVNESLLTGESVPVKKSVGDMLLSGSFISGGNCICRVEKIGDACYVQQLSIAAKKHKSPNSKLMSALNAMIKVIGLLIVPIAGMMAFVNYRVLSVNYAGFELFQEVILHTTTVIIGMIPSGMFLLTTMALCVGVIRLNKFHTLTQEMYSLEMLARVDVLCLDKTGTITDGQMVVKELIDINRLNNISSSDAIYSLIKVLGDNNQTSNALRSYFREGKDLAATAIIPFTSQKKLSAATFPGYGTFVLGAPSFVFSNLSQEIETEINTHMLLGRRILLFAHTFEPIENETLPTNLTALSIVVIEDNIRKEAIETIAWFKQNDVKIKVISGDDPITVSEISRRAGIEDAGNYICLTGLEENEIFNIANKYTVFGRVSPEQKAILVKALKALGHTVAMTGDGVNDILAMKESDCPVTVASGSSAARSVAHLVLLDNNFNSLPKVVAEGRRVINNIQQSSSLFLMKTLFTLTFALISILSGSKYPFAPRMIIMLEFFIIGIPSFVLSLQPNEKRVSGNFISYVLTHAIPGAIILIINVFTVQLITDAIGMKLTKEIADSMKVIILTFGGWVFLVNLCSPADKYKSVLAIIVTTILFLWAIFFLDSSFFKLASFSPFNENWQYILIMVCIVQFNFPLLRLLIKILERLGSSNNKLLSKLYVDN